MERIRCRMKALDQRLTQVKKELGKLIRQLPPECQPDNLEPSVDRIDLYISQILEEIAAAAQMQEDDKKLFKLDLNQKLIQECYDRRAIILLDRIPNYDDPPLDYSEDLPTPMPPNSGPDLNYVDIKDEIPSSSWNLVEYPAVDEPEYFSNDPIPSEDHTQEIFDSSPQILRKRSRGRPKKEPIEPKLPKILRKTIAKMNKGVPKMKEMISKAKAPRPPPRPRPPPSPQDKTPYFYCPLEGCPEKFPSNRAIAFEFHKILHSEPSLAEYQPGSGICPIQDCNKTFPKVKASLLHYHILSQHFNIHILPFPCSIPGCDKRFKTAALQNIHENTKQHSSGSPFLCSACGKACSSSNNLKIHKRRFHAPLQCPHCPRTFTKKESLDKHSQEHESTFICEHCGKEMPQTKQFTHMYTVHLAQKCGVGDCPEILESKEARRQHWKSAHTPDFICDQCTRSYYSLEDLNTHKYTHETTLICPWEGCGKSFSIRCKTPFKKHVESHQKDIDAQEKLRNSGGPTYPCDLCGRVYTQLQSLTYHKESFHEATNYICDFEGCGKSFNHARRLQQHKLYHKKEKSVCELCLRVYASPMMLKEHRAKAHRREINLGFNCGVCGGSYSKKGFLYKHLKSAHGVTE